MKHRLAWIGLLVLVAVGLVWLQSSDSQDRDIATSATPEETRSPELLPGSAPEEKQAPTSRAPEQGGEQETQAATRPGATVRLDIRPTRIRLSKEAAVLRAYYLAQETETRWSTAGTFQRESGERGVAKFVAASVPPGEYIAVVDTRYGTHEEGTHTRFSVPEGAFDEITVDVTWDAGDPNEVTHRLLVRVVDESGEPVSGARVAPMHYTTSGRWLKGNWITDGRGEVSIDAPAGRYVITVTSPAFATAQQRFEMQADHEQVVTLRRGTVTWTVRATAASPDIEHFQFGIYRKHDDPKWMWRSMPGPRSVGSGVFKFERLIASERYVVLLTGRKVAAQYWLPEGPTKNATWNVDVAKGRTIKIVPPEAIPEADLGKAGVQLGYAGMIGQLLTETRNLIRKDDHWVIEGIADAAAYVTIRWNKRTFTSRLLAAGHADAAVPLLFIEK